MPRYHAHPSPRTRSRARSRAGTRAVARAVARAFATIAPAALVACQGATAPTPTGVTTLPAPVSSDTTYRLVWSDEFDGPAGTAPDTARWGTEVGGQGWGNQELEYYTPGGTNAALDGAGHLVITAAPAPTGLTCWYGACRYTSARLTTKGKFSTTYGRIEARLRIPRGQGMWPAFWMLGADIDQVGWPRTGEIDIMENIGREPGIVHGTVHGPGYSGANGIGGPYPLATGAFADAYHVFAVDWSTGAVRWSVDGVLYRQTTTADLPAGGTWAFDHPFFLLLNVAVGGTWPGAPDASTSLPQTMAVDYVRVYRRGG